MAVTISTFTTATYGTAGSAFGSVINLSVVGGQLKTINTDNYPQLAGQLPCLAWVTLPAGNALEFSNDGGTTWTQAISGVGSGVFLFDGFTTRTGGASGGNWSFVALRAVLA